MTPEEDPPESIAALATRVAVLEERLSREVEARQRERQETLELLREYAEAAQADMRDLRGRDSRVTRIPSGT